MKLLIPTHLFGTNTLYGDILCIPTDGHMYEYIYSGYAFMSGTVTCSNGKVYRETDIVFSMVTSKPVKIENSTYGIVFLSKEKYKSYLKLKLKK